MKIVSICPAQPGVVACCKQGTLKVECWALTMDGFVVGMARDISSNLLIRADELDGFTNYGDISR